MPRSNPPSVIPSTNGADGNGHTQLSPKDLLQELEPTVRHGLETHLARATEWFPHEFVPYEVGRNYVEEPWE